MEQAGGQSRIGDHQGLYAKAGQCYHMTDEDDQS